MEEGLNSHSVITAGMSFGETIAVVFALGVFLWIVRPWGGTDTKGLPRGAMERVGLFLLVFFAFALLLKVFYK